MAKLNRPMRITIIVFVFLLFECTGLFSARIMDFDQSDPVLGRPPLRYFFEKTSPFKSYDHGQWLFYGDSILAGKKPFVDFFMDYGPYLYWLFSIPYRLFGQNPFAVIASLYFVFPIICFVIYCLAVRELFSGKEFMYAYLFFAWVVNLHFMWHAPMFRIALGLYSFSLVSRGWQRFDRFRIAFGGFWAVTTFFISPEMGIYASVAIISGSILMTFLFGKSHSANSKDSWLALLIGMGLAISLSAALLIPSGIFGPYLKHVLALAKGASAWHGGLPLWKTVPVIIGLLSLMAGINLYVGWKFSLERKELPPIIFSFLFCALAIKTIINRSDIHHIFFWFPCFLAYGLAFIEFSLKRIDISISFSIFPFLRRRLKLFYFVTLLFFASFLYLSSHFWIPDNYRWGWITWFKATLHSHWDNRLNVRRYKEMVYDKDIGMWLKSSRYLYLQETKQFLRSQVKPHEGVLCIPQSTLNPILGYQVPGAFFTPEHAFRPEYQKLLIQTLETDPPRFIVYDHETSWAHDSKDYLLQHFERFVEKHYVRDRRIGNLSIFRLSGRSEEDPYTQITFQSKSKGAGNLRNSIRLEFNREPIVAVDLHYILIPLPLTESLSRPYLKLSLLDGNKIVKKIYFLVPPSPHPVSLRVKIRPFAVVADQLEIGLSSRRDCFIFPQKVDILSLDVLKANADCIYADGFLLP